MDGILNGLNTAQLSAVTSPESVLQVLAPPGSGKTKTLTARVAFLLVEKQLKPWDIIVCTFTVKAAKEMKDRIQSVLGEKTATKLLLGTFHSVALRYLKQYGRHIGLTDKFGIADSSDSKAILKRIIKAMGLSMEPGQALGRISARKMRGETDRKLAKPSSSVEAQEFTRLFQEYEAALQASALLDYDDLLIRCSFLLKAYPDCVSNVQAVLIDEFQDTNVVQYELMGLLAQRNNRITIVGDPDQSIYGFRAAEIKNLSRMQAQWRHTITINLEENYRSSGAILHAAQNVIEQDQSRPQKALQATHGYGLRPVLRRLPSAYAEAEWLVSEVIRMQAVTGKMLQYSDFAILLRSSALSRAVETALGNSGIPYRMVGGLRFYDRYEVKLVVDYLRAIHNPDNSEAVERILNVPSRRIGEETIKKLRDEARSRETTLWKLILDIAQSRITTATKISEPARKGLDSFVGTILGGRKKMVPVEGAQPSITDLMNLVSQKISLQSHLRAKEAGDEKSYEARWANVEELMAQADDLTSPAKIEEAMEAERLPSIDGLEQSATSTQDILAIFLANIALASSAEQRAETTGEKLQQITISTIHAAKGLEWPVVFVPACYEGSIPHSRAEDNDEERRLLYVAMTRAQGLLYLSCPVRNTQREDTIMSTFLTQPKIQSCFEEHGPSMPSNAVASLSKTLRRVPPEAEMISEARKGLLRDEDNHWPLTGEEPLEGGSRWDAVHSAYASSKFERVTQAELHPTGRTTMDTPTGFSIASATMRSGFVSAKARYDEVREEQEQLRKIDKRKEDVNNARQVPKGKKRQMDGHTDIANFFAKRTKPECNELLAQHSRLSPITTSVGSPLRDISNTALVQGETRQENLGSLVLSHKPRNAAMPKRPNVAASATAGDANGKYVFLSSSPTREDTLPETAQLDTSNMKSSSKHSVSTQRASTFHTTSMDHVSQPRKTFSYGVKRSLHGWPPRPKP